MKVLVTGFDPFGGEVINPSYEAVKLLPECISGAEIVKAELPTLFSASAEKLVLLIEKELPDIVICTGQAGGRDSVTPERVAINLRDARIPDNIGNMPCDEPIYNNEKEAFFSTLPIKDIVAGIEAEKIPARVSNTAGTFVCNEVMYSLMRYIERSHKKMIGGFIHIPYIPEQTEGKEGTFALSLERAASALEIAVCISIKYYGEKIN